MVYVKVIWQKILTAFDGCWSWFMKNKSRSDMENGVWKKLLINCEKVHCCLTQGEGNKFESNLEKWYKNKSFQPLIHIKTSCYHSSSALTCFSVELQSLVILLMLMVNLLPHCLDLNRFAPCECVIYPISDSRDCGKQNRAIVTNFICVSTTPVKKKIPQWIVSVLYVWGLKRNSAKNNKSRN